MGLMPRQKLWDFFAQEHNLHLVDTELNDIVMAVEKYQATESKFQTFYAVEDDTGQVNHVTLRLDKEDAIADFMETEQAMNLIVNVGRFERGELAQCAKSWEQLEAQGFSVVPVRILKVKP